MTDIGGDFLALRGYLAGDLPSDQIRALEERLEREPGLVRELELHLRMREGFEQVQVQRERAMAAARRRELRAWASGLAAAAGCAGLALLLWSRQGASGPAFLQATLPSEPVATDTAPVTAQFTFVPVRGASRPDLQLPLSGRIELRASPGRAAGSGPYRVTLSREQAQGRGQGLGSVTGVRVASDGYLHAFVDAAHLTGGDYLLRVEPDPKTESAGEAFRFRLQPSGH